MGRTNANRGGNHIKEPLLTETREKERKGGEQTNKQTHRQTNIETK